MFLGVFWCIALVATPVFGSVANLVKSHGYPLEIHNGILSSDGYYLNAHRIPNNKTTRDPVLLLSGMFLSSDSFVVLGPKKSLAFLLADEGYDVWMGDVRSVSYSRHHVSYDPDKDKEFWNFSLQELGVNDLPAIVDHVLKETKSERLVFVGHSQGSTLLAILCSERPAYCSKIKLALHMAPGIYFGDAPHPVLREVVKHTSELERLAEFFQIYELIPGRELLSNFGPILCSLPIANFICTLAIALVVGSNPKQLNRDYVPTIIEHLPEGTGVKQFLHLLQFQQTAKFRKYDYGSSKNLLTYGSEEPSSYDVSKMSMPTAFYFSDADVLINSKNIAKLSQDVPNVVESYKMPDLSYTHLDFIYANDNRLLHTKMLQLIERYNKD